MALNREELKKRIVTAVVGGGLMISLLAYGGVIGCFALVTLISLGMAYEYSNLIFSLPDQQEKKYAFLFLAWLVAILNYGFPNLEFHFVMFSFLALFLYFLFTAGRFVSSEFESHLKELMYSFFGLGYLVFLPTYITKIRSMPQGMHYVFLFLFIIWAGDTAAYFFGLKFGKHRLYREVSPKKSWEGAFGGLAGGLVVGFLYQALFFKDLSTSTVIIAAITVGIVAQAGDLCESFIKRSFIAKDSGSILPGHGGLLDRFDGVLFGAPIMYLCVRFFS